MKQLPKYLKVALSDLNRLIDDGIEFPTAIERISERHSLSDSQIERVKGEYDTQAARAHFE